MPSDTSADLDAPVPFEPSRPMLPPRQPPPRSTASPLDGDGEPETAFERQMRLAGLPMPTLPIPSARPPRPTAGQRLARAARRLAVVGVIAGLVYGGIAGYHRLQSSRDKVVVAGDNASAVEWDDEIAPLAAFVETSTGRAFEHAIPVQYLDDAAFAEALGALATENAPEVPVTDDDRQRQLALADAAGLRSASGPADAAPAPSPAASIAFYDPNKDELEVHGADLGPAAGAVIVHELTRALRAQVDELGANVDTGRLEWRAIIEGDAARVEDAYVAALTDDDRAALGGNAPSNAPGIDLASAAATTVDRLVAPWILGPAFFERSGPPDADAIDALLLDPPTVIELLDPDRPGDDAGPPRVDITAPSDTEVFAGPAPWSAYDALAMLDAWLPWTDARAAIDGWSTGSSVAYTRNGTVCFSAGAQFSTQPDADRFLATVAAWAAASGSTAAPTNLGPLVTFEACARGGAGHSPPKPILLTSSEIATEWALVRESEGATVTSAHAWHVCVARSLVDDHDYVRLHAESSPTTEDQAAMAKAMDVAHWVCGPQPG